MKEVYLDNSATTMAYRSVGELVQKVMCEDYGNPSSMHNKGVEAEKYIKEAKETISKLLKVNAKEIIFTSGGTESDNLALIGAAKANRRAGMCAGQSKERKSSDHFLCGTSCHFEYNALSGRGRRISRHVSSC